MGSAADRDGNGYWAQMAIDTVGIGERQVRHREGDEAAPG